MNHYVQIGVSGLVVGRGSTNAPLSAIPSPPGGQVLRLGSDVPVGAPLFFDGSQVRVAPAAPSPFHVLQPKDGTWVLDEAAAWASVRSERERRITATDWRVVRAQEDSRLLEPEWRAYRQALRDITDQPDPLRIIWPTPPA